MVFYEIIIFVSWKTSTSNPITITNYDNTLVTKKGPWAVHLTLCSNRGWADIAGINTGHYKTCKAVQIMLDIMG